MTEEQTENPNSIEPKSKENEILRDRFIQRDGEEIGYCRIMAQ